MSEETKTFVFPENGGKMDASTLLALMNGNGGFGGNGNWLWVIFLFFLYGWGGNGLFGRGNGLSGELNNDYGRSLLMSAIQGNGNAISELSTKLHVDTSAIQNALCSLGNAVQNVAGQVGLTAQQTINAIQSGNQALASQLASCCCENKLLVQSQGYENQIATLNQTNQLGSKMDSNTATLAAQIAAQTTEMNNQFCALKERELQNKIDSLIAANSALQTAINNAQQTSQIQAFVSSLVAPIQKDVNDIKAAQPSTTVVQYPNLTAIPTYLANGLYGQPYFCNGPAWA